MPCWSRLSSGSAAILAARFGILPNPLPGKDAAFKSQAMLPKSLRQDAGDSRQDGGAPPQPDASR
jgi:hypothetical protein